jgi:hypothetical protein
MAGLAQKRFGDGVWKVLDILTWVQAITKASDRKAGECWSFNVRSESYSDVGGYTEVADTINLVQNNTPVKGNR